MGSNGKQHTFLGHPVGLYVLFFTEMWERFSYYGMRGLLMLYMVNYFLWTHKDASRIYKWYTGLVYLTPILGGYLADRYLGNKRAVIIGALLMAIGHFLMAFEAIHIFYAALIFLIIGNGFFKPNMSTQVGRLYPINDPRRDGAYTIFYMGINLGAFLSPLICGWLAENTIGKYHSGFTMAGIGMVFGLVIYLVGQPWVREIADNTGEPGAKPAGEAMAAPAEETGMEVASPAPAAAISEAVAEQTPSALPHFNLILPRLLAAAGLLLIVASPLFAPWTKLLGMENHYYPLEFISWDTLIALEIAGICGLISAGITAKVHLAVRDRVMAIFVLGIFVVFFWTAFEQAGNVLNVWADKDTDRQLTGASKPPDVYPEVEEDAEVGQKQEAGTLERFFTMFQLKEKKKDTKEKKEDKGFTVPTAWFQSINALAIFVLAPLFAWLWTALERRRWNPSVPTKMALGLVFMALSLVVMMGAAQQENQSSSAVLKAREGTAAQLPASLIVEDDKRITHKDEKGNKEPPYDSGRLTFDKASHTFHLQGVLSDLERDHIVRDTAPADYQKKVEELARKSNYVEDPKVGVSVSLDVIPPAPGFDMKYAGFKKSEVSYDPKTQILTAKKRLADKDVKALLVAAGDPQLRDTLTELMIESSKFRVSMMWLFWSYILATLGELCLSPVGLSMVSKLAPARFATLLMGMWLLTSFFGNFAAGALGEIWETMTPTNFFLLFVVALGGASVVLFLIVRKVVSLMHGVN